MYADSSMTTQKSEQADIVIQAIEKYSYLITMNMQEIFIWYFKQKGVDSPERFLGAMNDGGAQQFLLNGKWKMESGKLF